MYWNEIVTAPFVNMMIACAFNKLMLLLFPYMKILLLVAVLIGKTFMFCLHSNKMKFQEPTSTID